MISKLTRSFNYAFRGLKFAYLHDQSFRMEVWVTPLVFLFGYTLWPLTMAELLFLALGVTLIYITELINTSFERALDRLHPEQHELIGKSKDIASAAVFVAIIFTFIVVLTITLSRFGVLY